MSYPARYPYQEVDVGTDAEKEGYGHAQVGVEYGRLDHRIMEICLHEQRYLENVMLPTIEKHR